MNEQIIQLITLGLSGLSALISSAVVEGIKRIPFLKDEEKSRLGGPAAQLVAALCSVATGYGLAWASQQIGLLEQSNIWPFVVAVLTPILAEFKYQGTRAVRK